MTFASCNFLKTKIFGKVIDPKTQKVGDRIQAQGTPWRSHSGTKWFVGNEQKFLESSLNPETKSD